MPIISFKKQFAELVKNGTKRQTIRKVGKRVYKEGDILHVYTGLRTKYCKKIGDYKIESVHKIRFFNFGVEYWPTRGILWCDDLAKKDGFQDYKEMLSWFKNQYGDELFKTQFQVITFKDI